MKNLKKIEKTVDALRQSAIKEINNGNYNCALECVFNCAEVQYIANYRYADVELENLLEELAERMNLEKPKCTNDIVILYDGIGENSRGLIRIYLKALCRLKKVVYVTYASNRNSIPDLLEILSKNGSKALFINDSRNDFVSKINSLNEILQSEKPNVFICYSFENDVVAATVMSAYKGSLNRYLINITDHAFWLGASCIDKCIEFRDYGASISKKYRRIPEEKIVKLPFYPDIHKEIKFQGYPFCEFKGQKVVFSGGSLYKTFGDDNRYYRLIDTILSNDEKAVFWYAGSGDDSELRKIAKKHPNRVYHTDERADLLQVLEHSHAYLSTYPVNGGLMFQYAAKAGKVPVTLKSSDCSEGFLLKQAELEIEFDNEKELLIEISRLLNDDNYRKTRAEQMKDAVISENEFENLLFAIINNEVDHQLAIKYDEDIDTSAFRQIYLDRLSNHDIELILINKATIKSALKYRPVRFILFGIEKAFRKICLGY